MSAVSLFADQAALITKEQAENGSKLIKSSGEIRYFCAPCGDNFYRVEKVSNLEVVKADSKDPKDSYYEVKVNGVGVDLAYVYVLFGGKWANAAMLLKIKVQGVPDVLPDELPNDEIDPGDMPSGYDMNDYSGKEDLPLEEGD